MAIRKAGDALAKAARTQLAEAYLQEMRARKEPMIFDLEEYWRRNNIPESEQDWGAPTFDDRNLEAAVAQEGAASLSPSELRVALNSAAKETSIDPQSLSGPEKISLIADFLNDSGRHNYGIWPVQDPRGTYGATVFNYDKSPGTGLLIPDPMNPHWDSGGRPPYGTSFLPVPGGKFTHYFEQVRPNYDLNAEPSIYHTTLSTPTARKVYQGLIQERGARKEPTSHWGGAGIDELIDEIWRVRQADEITSEIGPTAYEVLAMQKVKEALQAR